MWQVIIPIAISILSLVVALLSALYSNRNATQQNNTLQEQNRLTQEMQGLTQEQNRLTQIIDKQEKDFERKRFVISLWDKMAEVISIHPDDDGKYDERAVQDALDTLELVSICWRENIVDRWMVYLVFGKSFVLLVDEIKGIRSPLEILRKTGPELLLEKPVITMVEQEIQSLINSGTTRNPGI